MSNYRDVPFFPWWRCAEHVRRNISMAAFVNVVCDMASIIVLSSISLIILVHVRPFINSACFVWHSNLAKRVFMISNYSLSFIPMLTNLRRVSDTSSSELSYPILRLMVGLRTGGVFTIAFALFTVASCVVFVDKIAVSLICVDERTSVKVLSSRAMDRSCFSILNRPFFMGTATRVVCTSTMSPTRNTVGSTRSNLMTVISLIKTAVVLPLLPRLLRSIFRSEVVIEDFVIRAMEIFIIRRYGR